jgi:hypothetical protein
VAMGVPAGVCDGMETHCLILGAREEQLAGDEGGGVKMRGGEEGYSCKREVRGELASTTTSTSLASPTHALR